VISPDTVLLDCTTRTANFNLEILENNIDQLDRLFTLDLVLENGSNATLVNSQVQVTILDNDSEFTHGA
jgi:hypothetical protein